MPWNQGIVSRLLTEYGDVQQSWWSWQNYGEQCPSLFIPQIVELSDFDLCNRWNCAVSLHPIWILSIACAIQGPASIVAYQVRFVSFKPLVQVWVQVFELFQYLLMLSSTILKVNKMIFLSCSVSRQVRMQDKWTQHKLQNGIMVMVMEISMPNYI